MNVETATKIILRPYITEKTYALEDNEKWKAIAEEVRSKVSLFKSLIEN